MLVMLIARKHLGLLPASSSPPDKLGTKVVPLAIDLSESSLPRSGGSSRSVALDRSSFDSRERKREKERERENDMTKSITGISIIGEGMEFGNREAVLQNGGKYLKRYTERALHCNWSNSVSGE